MHYATFFPTLVWVMPALGSSSDFQITLKGLNSDSVLIMTELKPGPD